MRFLWALLPALLLCGCHAKSPAVPAAVMETTAAPSIATGYYACGSDMEVQTNGAVRTYPLDLPDAYGLKAIGEDLLVFSLDGTTQLTVLTGDTLVPAAQKELPFLLSPDALQISSGELRYYDLTTAQMMVLDPSLNLITTIPVPEALTGTPLLSADRKTLYYCTADALRAWDLKSGIHRCIKEMAYDRQSVSGLHRDDTILACTILDGNQEQTLFLSADTGTLLKEHRGTIQLQTLGGHYYAAFPCGVVQALVFGSETPSALTPRDLTGATTFLPRHNAAVSCFAPNDRQLRMDYYRLADGCRISSLEWENGGFPVSIDTAGTYVYFLAADTHSGGNVIYRWSPEMLPASDSSTYTGTYYTRENPDLDGLARCRIYANLIGQQHGIQVKIWEDAAAAEPWDYELEAEYLVPVLEEALHDLEQQLSHYPEGMLADTASHFSSLTICLVRSISGSAESGSLDAATGIQFFDGTDAYVAIAPGQYSRQALYHELFHVMETHLLTQPTALDRWEEWNPSGFRYDYSYITNKNRDSGIYLQEATRAFVDTYSMSFPKEDKARVMEYAMLPDMAPLFQSDTMQAKLECLSTGLREAYGLEDCKEIFLWEQYLE